MKMGLERLKYSIYSPSFYAKVTALKFRGVISYFILLTGIVSLVRFGWILSEIKGLKWEQVNLAIANVVARYPEELIVRIENGKASTNVEEPYFVGGLGGEQILEGNRIDNVVVIDTKTPFSFAQFEKYNALVWLSREALFVVDEKQGIRALPLENIGNLVVDREKVVGLGRMIEEKYTQWLPMLKVGITVLMGLFVYMAVSSVLLKLLFVAVLIWLLGKIMGRSWSYAESYKIGIFASTLPLVVETVKMVLLPEKSIPFMFTLVCLIVVYINFKDQQKSIGA